jgi:hypothetical protein
MTPGAELRKLKSELTSFDCLNYEDLKFYTHKIASHIRKIYENDELEDGLLNKYVDCVILKHLAIIEEFINSASSFSGKEEFITKALKYHFNCIIDSYTYATVAHQHQ